MRTLSCFALALLVAAAPAYAGAQKKVKAAAPAKEYTVQPFDASLEKLSTAFEGNPAYLLYDALEQRLKKTTKDEFETSAEHAARVKTLEDVPLLGKIRLSDRVVFVAKDYPEFSYNADEQSMSGSIPSYGFLSSVELHLGSSSKQIGQFVGSNAFGVKRKIRRYSDEWLNLAFRLPSGDAFHIPKIELSTYLANVQCEGEKQCKGHRWLAAFTATRVSRVLVTGFLDEPYISSELEETTATIDDPEERSILKRRIHIRPDQIWIYDSASGAVLRKFDVDEVWGKKSITGVAP